MGRHSGRKTKGRVQCPCCGKDVSYNHLGTIAMHKPAKGARRCPASFGHRGTLPRHFDVERPCPLCTGTTYSPKNKCLDPVFHRPRVS